MDYKRYKFGLDKDTTWDGEKIGRFDAFFPKEDSSPTPMEVKDIPKYVEIRINNKTHYFKTTTKDSRRGKIYVSKAIYNGKNIEEISFKKSRHLQFLVYKIRNDRNQQVALAGLIIAILGLVIDGSLAIGKAKAEYIKWILTDEEILLLMIFAIVLKALGLFIVYRKGLLSES